MCVDGGIAKKRVHGTPAPKHGSNSPMGLRLRGSGCVVCDVQIMMYQIVAQNHVEVDHETRLTCVSFDNRTFYKSPFPQTGRDYPLICIDQDGLVLHVQRCVSP